MLSSIDPIIKREASRWGLTLAAVNIAFYLVAYLGNRGWFVSITATSILFLINVVVLIVAVVQARQAMGGFITFKDAFSVSFFTALIYSMLGTVFIILLFNVVDPAAAIEIQNLTIENTIAMAERFGGNTDQIDEMIEALENTKQFGVKQQVSGFFTGLIFSAIMSAIIAAFMKKTPPFNA